MNSFIFQELGDRTNERIGIAGTEREQQLGKPPVRTDAAEDLLVLYLPGHEGAGDTFSLEGIDELGEFAQREPVDLRPILLDGGSGLFFNGHDNNFIPLCSSRV